MRTYTIGEVAERSGFSPSALRYYEQIGLVVPSARTGANYRLYDDHALARLAFVTQAKQLGCSLDEITDLLGIWDGEECGPVQQRLRRLVTTKIADARGRIEGLAALTDELRDAAARLSTPAGEGPCGPECACMTDSAPRGAFSPPLVCTLGSGDVEPRVRDWHALLAQATDRVRTREGIRVVFDRNVDVEALARLVAAEQECCAFFTFAIVVEPGHVTLDVHAPPEARPVVDVLFGDEA